MEDAAGYRASVHHLLRCASINQPRIVPRLGPLHLGHGTAGLQQVLGSSLNGGILHPAHHCNLGNVIHRECI